MFGGASDVFQIANQWETLKQNRLKTQNDQMMADAGKQTATAMKSQQAADASAPNPAVNSTGAPSSASSTGTNVSTGAPTGTSGGPGTPGFDLSGMPTPNFIQKSKAALPVSTPKYLANDGYGTGLSAPGSPTADTMQPALPPRASGAPGQTSGQNSVQNSSAMPAPASATPRMTAKQAAANRAGLEQVYGANAAAASGAVASAIPAAIRGIGRGIADTATAAAQGAGYGAGLPNNMVAPQQAVPTGNPALPAPRTAAPQYLPNGAIPGVTVAPGSTYAQPAVGAYPAPSSMATPMTNSAMPSLAGGQVGLGGMILRALNPTGAP
ncbi:MAG TPA: hypothetical protein VGM09_03270 [Bradyrhizobium sp.]